MKKRWANPLFRRLIAIIKQYEDLRHQNYFSDSIRALLREPGKEFTLFQEENGRWNFKRVSYQKHKTSVTGNSSLKWTTHNEFDAQPVKIRLMSVNPYSDRANVVLTDFSGSGEFAVGGAAEGVSGDIKPSNEKSGAGTVSGLFSAISQGPCPREGMWIKMEKKFDPWLNIINNQGLGVWVKGDGKGELQNFRIESPQHLSFCLQVM
jgi:hypothetical protein